MASVINYFNNKKKNINDIWPPVVNGVAEI